MHLRQLVRAVRAKILMCTLLQRHTVGMLAADADAVPLAAVGNVAYLQLEDRTLHVSV
jgi:hypothetical protein